MTNRRTRVVLPAVVLAGLTLVWALWKPCAADGEATQEPRKIQHEFLAMDESRAQFHYVNEREPEKDWTIKLPHKCRDLQLIGSNKALLSAPWGYCEYDLGAREKTKELNNPMFSEAQTARRRIDGSTIIGCDKKSGIVVFELDSTDKVIQTAEFPGMKTIRLLRLTPRGTVLFGANGGAIIEAKLDGTIVREVSVAGARHNYQILEKGDGSLLAACGYGAFLAEIASDGTIARKIGGKPAPDGLFFKFFAGFQVMKNGDIVVCNWTGHGANDSRKGPQLLHYDRSGKIVWKWRDPERAGTLHGVIVLDDLDTNVLNDDINLALGPVGGKEQK